MILKKYDTNGEVLVGEYPDAALIEQTVRAMDWQVEDIVGVTLERDRQNWADGSGSLSPRNGLSLMIEDGGVQHVSVNAPTTIDEVIEFLIAYNRSDRKRVYEILLAKEVAAHEIDAMNEEVRSGQQFQSLIVAFGLFVCIVIVILVATGVL